MQKSWPVKNVKPYEPYSLDAYLMALVGAYLSFFLCKTLIFALIGPFLFFAIMAIGITADLFGREKNLINAILRFLYLLLVLTPIIIISWIRLHH
jgi:uncharacterized membrane protein YhaH (DUF805 family)